MDSSISQQIKIGIFVVVGILILLAGIFLIGSKKNMFSNTYTIYAVFRNAGGLRAGNNVRFGGVDVGTIKSVRILKDTVIRVDMIIQSAMKVFIKKDAIASVSSDGLMGDKLLSIAPGAPNAPVLEAGKQISTEEPTDFAAIINKFSTVASNAQVITGALADMALQIKEGNGSVSRLLYRNDLALSLEGSLNNLKNITGSVNGITAYIQSGKGSLGSLIYTDSLSKSLSQTVSSANFALLTIQKAADNFSENMKALQGNYFLKGYFKKKNKAKADSLNAGAEDIEMNDAELESIKENADKELQRRHSKDGK
jgi:phospholipid/cholesterol/gamma-HCH transport system substrate-binding protein